jgi:hypothetical protein
MIISVTGGPVDQGMAKPAGIALLSACRNRPGSG